jgi:hypothetical protein
VAGHFAVECVSRRAPAPGEPRRMTESEALASLSVGSEIDHRAARSENRRVELDAAECEVFWAVGDPRRPLIKRAVLGTFVAAGVFSVLTGPVKQLSVFYDHAPWLNDPYDTMVSFMMLFVPLITVLGLSRVVLCRTSAPLPTGRVRDLLRACRVVLAGIGVTVLTEWVSVAVHANGRAWSPASWLQIGFLVVETAMTAWGSMSLRSAPSVRLPAGRGDLPDWLGDALAIAEREAPRLGTFDRLAFAGIGWARREVVIRVRRHPLWAAAICCAGFGGAVGLNQALREGYTSGSTVAVVVLLTSGMFGLLVTSGQYLGLVRSPSPLIGRRRRAVDATVLTSLLVLVPFALRARLWFLVDTSNAVAGVAQLAEMLALCAVVIFASVLVTEEVIGLHGDDQSVYPGIAR